MTRLIALLAVCLGLAVPDARAEGPILVELFSSQNCRACPAAHRTLAAVQTTRDDVLVLTWSVDYWDYLGGKDKMALPESKSRQRGYVDRFSLRGPYTPQTVYGGIEQCAGNKPKKVDAALATVKTAAASDVRLGRQGKALTLDGKPGMLTDIWWVTYLSGDANTTPMVNPVTAARSLGPWLGGKARIDMPACEASCALIVQEAGYGRVLSVLSVAP